ncbi:putative tol protein [Botrytis fragariae]|uniref:Putative tol protein n=1 Tax=Botrytis fragariae TaxID=1964551 RepID=A0A8H6AKZ8_9HELO|nr:putative tol protein [Botrytis fragariae]KAF5869349.1 putative tol protein [Botrytis fragariae]
MSLAEKRSGVDSDGDDDEIVDIRELGLELGAVESDAMGRLSSDAIGTDSVEVGDVCEAQERGNAELFVEVDGKNLDENLDIDGESNDDPTTNDSGYYPDQDSGVKNDTDELREEAFRGNEGNESIEIHVSDDSDGYNVTFDGDVDVGKHNDEIPLVEREESEEEESSDDCNSDYSDFLSRSEINVPQFVRWPIEDPQVAEEKMESEKNMNATTAEVLNPDLCKFCRVFFDTWSDVYNLLSKTCTDDVNLVSAHHDTVSDMEASASGGCSLCALFLSILYSKRDNSNSRAHEGGNHLPLDQLKPYRMRLTNVGQMRSGENRPERRKLWYILLDFQWVDDGRRSVMSALAKLLLDDFFDSEHWKPEYYTNRSFEQNGWESLQLGCTKESTDLVRAWLRECRLSHSACRQQQEASALPTRLIKIDCQEVRLCISANENCSQYATLSHCWGQVEVLRLQKDNLQAFMKKIPHDKLCKTFRDAIDIARVLGFSWLWIDSLCIIQGDPEDWSKEASRMAIVYGLSSLNIAATAAPDGTIGCLFGRDLRKIGAHKVEVNSNHQKKVCSIADWRFYANNISGAALTKRAWAVQERILASRTLHFTKSQIFWECRTKQACETFPDTLPEAVCNDYLYLPRQELQSWSNIIRVYTNCSLTNESDRLIAIGGVARQLQNRTGDKYFAGLWQSRIKEQMCWYMDKNLAEPSRERTCQAPSWSWVAAKGRVHMPDDKKVLRKSFIHVTNVMTTLEDNDDPFGGVKSGTLELRTKFMTFCERETPFDQYVGIPLGKISISPFYINWDHKDCGPKRCCNSILILPIGISEVIDANDCPQIEGLLLRHTDQENGQYERLGAFTIFEGRAGYELICRAMNLAQDEQFEELGLLEDDGTLPSEKDYISTDVGEDGITWYTISIV